MRYARNGMAASKVSLKGIFFIFLGSSSNKEVTSACKEKNNEISQIVSLTSLTQTGINHFQQRANIIGS